MTKLLKSYIFLFVIIFSLFFNINIVVLASGVYDFNKNSGLKDVAENGAGYSTTNAFRPNNLYGAIGKAISIIFSFLGVIFLCLMIYGGYAWMMAKGNEANIEKAQNIIRNALIGLIIVLSAYAITAFIGYTIIKAPAISTPVK